MLEPGEKVLVKVVNRKGEEIPLGYLERDEGDLLMPVYLNFRPAKGKHLFSPVVKPYREPTHDHDRLMLGQPIYLTVIDRDVAEEAIRRHVPISTVMDERLA